MLDELRLGNSPSVYIRVVHCPVFFYNIHDFQRLCIGQGTPFQTGSFYKVRHSTAVGGYGIIHSRQGPYCFRYTIHSPARGRYYLDTHAGTAFQHPAVAL